MLNVRWWWKPCVPPHPKHTLYLVTRILPRNIANSSLYIAHPPTLCLYTKWEYVNWEGHSNPLQYSYLENSTDRGAWRATVHRVAKSQTRLKQLSMHTHLYLGIRLRTFLLCCPEFLTSLTGQKLSFWIEEKEYSTFDINMRFLIFSYLSLAS